MIDSQKLNLLYPFQVFDKRFLIDLPSGFPKKISECAWELIVACKTNNGNDLKHHFSGEEIEQARKEIEEKFTLGALGGQVDGGNEDLKPTGIFSALINLTHQCNMACRYCLMALDSLKEGYYGVPDGMTEETGRNAIDFLHEAGVPSPVSLTFFGGEPFLEFPLMKKLVTYAETHYPGRFFFNIITNGTLLTDEAIDFIEKHRIGLVFSIDGDRERNDRLRIFKNGKGSVFDRAFGNLTRLIRRVPGARYKVNITYFKQTLELSESFRFFLETGIRQTRYERGLTERKSPYALDDNDVETVKKEFSKMATMYRDFLLSGGFHIQDNFVILMKKLSNGIPRFHGCNMGVDYVTIASNGDIYPCHKLIGLPTSRMGHVSTGFDNSFYDELWHKNVLSRHPCRTCWARFICGGLCASDNYHYNGDFLTPVPKNCRIMRHLIKLSCWLLSELEDRSPDVLKRLLGTDYLKETDIPSQRRTVLESREGNHRLLNRETSGEYLLNGPALEIFEACNGKNTVKDIAEHLTSVYGIPMDVAIQDVRNTLHKMARNGLVTLPDAGTPSGSIDVEC